MKAPKRAAFVNNDSLAVAVIGLAMPWYDGLHFFWWYGLVAACAVYAAAVAWRAGEAKSS
ncbi:hypothetical protein [Corynebacterium aurimucosum]|uniref:hypothetical protein n=1 Tax=Corynebacterium aurimucosum TaxID=169292 RepID=UPI0039905044